MFPVSEGYRFSPQPEFSPPQGKTPDRNETQEHPATRRLVYSPGQQREGITSRAKRLGPDSSPVSDRGSPPVKRMLNFSPASSGSPQVGLLKNSPLAKRKLSFDTTVLPSVQGDSTVTSRAKKRLDFCDGTLEMETPQINKRGMERKSQEETRCTPLIRLFFQKVKKDTDRDLRFHAFNKAKAKEANAITKLEKSTYQVGNSVEELSTSFDILSVDSSVPFSLQGDFFSTNASQTKSGIVGDRFIHSRRAMETAKSVDTYGIADPNTQYKQVLMEGLFPYFSQRTLMNKAELFQPIQPKFFPWKFPDNSTLELDAPDVKEDFYCHNVDLNNLYLALNFKDKTCFYQKRKKEIISIQHESPGELTCVKLNPTGASCVRADSQSGVTLVSLANLQTRRIASNVDHSRSISSLEWKSSTELTVGTENKIVHYDTRMQKAAWKVLIPSIGKVSALKWRDDSLALASETGKVRIYDAKKIQNGNCQSVHFHQHTAPVRALEWNPHHSSLLLSGGEDGVIKLFDTAGIGKISTTSTDSSISALFWLDKEYFVIGAGQQIQYWQTGPESSTLQKIYQVAHGSLILDLAYCSQGSQFVSLGSDEAVCFWNLKSLVEKSEIEQPFEDSLHRSWIR